jgi:hypothetical protein
MSELDELLQPTVAPAEQRPLPWRVSSQFWVAFLGGIPAVTAIAFLNARRLGVSASKQRWIVLAGVVALAISIALMGWLTTSMEDGRRTGRIAVRVLAVVLFLVLARIQRDEDGRHQVFGSGEYASMWLPGILATVISAVLLVGIALLVMQLLK